MIHRSQESWTHGTVLVLAAMLIGSPWTSDGYAADGPSSQRHPHVGSWGDQGDGTYCNPILNADYPDVDVEQLGDTYYMISSKQHMSPGMVHLLGPVVSPRSASAGQSGG